MTFRHEDRLATDSRGERERERERELERERESTRVCARVCMCVCVVCVVCVVWCVSGAAVCGVSDDGPLLNLHLLPVVILLLLILVPNIWGCNGNL